MGISEVSRVNSVSGTMQTRQSDVVLRIESIRRSLRKYGAAMVDLNNSVDLEAIKRFSKIHGAENVQIERSSHARLTIRNFKR